MTMEQFNRVCNLSMELYAQKVLEQHLFPGQFDQGRVQCIQLIQKLGIHRYKK